MTRKQISTYYPLVQRIDDWPYYPDDPEAYKSHMRQYYYFMVEDYPTPFGYVHVTLLQSINWPPCWEIDHEKRFLRLTVPHPNDTDLCRQRTGLILETLYRAHLEGKVKRLRTWSDELVPVRGRDGEHILNITTRAGHIFGTVSYGVSLIAWTPTENGKKYWLQRRSMKKTMHPGKLDTTASGALRPDELPLQGLIREATEETGLDPKLIQKAARSCGTISYHLSWNSDGSPTSMPHVLYTYEMELPPGTTPTPADGEVERFVTMSESEVSAALYGDEFKPIVGVIWLGHFYRHGIMTPENEPHFEEICCRIHRQHRMFIA